jgi:MOSC domain-containing protein YiiM
MLSVDRAEIVAGKGISGDASFGREKRQILIVAGKVLQRYELLPGEIRENLVVADLDVDTLQTGEKVRVGEVTLEVSGPCEPCSKLDKIRKGLQHELVGQRGVLARALTHGEIVVGDVVEIEMREPRQLSQE